MSPPLKNPPVYFTVVQVRFNPLLRLSEYLPSIQDGLRRKGYPAFTKQSTIALQFNTQESQTVPQSVAHDQYFFSNIEQTHSFLLGADALIFQSTNYGTYEHFLGAFLDGLALVHEVVELDFTERVGLRYLDHVLPKAGDALEHYLAREVQGLGSTIGGRPVYSFVEMLNVVGDVQLRSRILTQDGELAFPPDLQPQRMSVSARFTKAKGEHAMIDTDGFVQRRELFSLSGVRKYLDDIHDVIGVAFRNAVTPYALAVWDE